MSFPRCRTLRLEGDYWRYHSLRLLLPGDIPVAIYLVFIFIIFGLPLCSSSAVWSLPRSSRSHPVSHLDSFSLSSVFRAPRASPLLGFPSPSTSPSHPPSNPYSSVDLADRGFRTIFVFALELSRAHVSLLSVAPRHTCPPPCYAHDLCSPPLASHPHPHLHSTRAARRASSLTTYDLTTPVAYIPSPRMPVSRVHPSAPRACITPVPVSHHAPHLYWKVYQ